jgi:hypothetical protein
VVFECLHALVVAAAVAQLALSDMPDSCSAHAQGLMTADPPAMPCHARSLDKQECVAHLQQHRCLMLAAIGHPLRLAHRPLQHVAVAAVVLV